MLAALLLPLAICSPSPRYCSCVQAIPPSAFVTTYKSSRLHNIASIRRRVSLHSLSENVVVEEDVDDTFFVQASKKAAQQRIQLLKQEQNSSDATGGAEKDDAVEGNNNADVTAAATATSITEEELQRSSPVSPVIKVPIDPFQETQRSKQQMKPKPSQTSSYDFQRKLLEARLIMDKKEANLDVGGKDLGEDVALDSSITEAIISEAITSSPAAVATEEKIPESKLEVDDSTSVLGGPPSYGALATDGRAEKESTGAETNGANVPEHQSTTNPRLSSDGKEIFEPSSSSLEMDQENIDMGLLVLTRSMLTLKSILDKDES